MHTLRVVILCPLAVERRQAGQRARAVVGVRADVNRTGPGASRIRQAVAELATRSAAARPPDLVVLFGLAGGLRRTSLTPRIERVVDCERGQALTPNVALWATTSDRSEGATIVMTDQPVVSSVEKRRLAEALDADLVDCESRAFAQTCEQHSLRWSIVRGVSDGPDDALPATAADWLDDAGAARPVRVLADLARGRASPAALWRLGVGAMRGLRAAGLSLRALLEQEAREQREGLPPSDARSILLFGGVFDPPHRAHVELALEAMRASACDWLVFMPAASAPLRSDRARAGPRDRYDMLAAAIRDATGAAPATEASRCCVSGVELARPGASYTIDTIGAIRRRLGARPTLRLLIGADQAAQFHQWREAQRLLGEAPPVVILRPPFDSADALLKALAPHWPEDALADWRERIMESQTLDVSSTALRNALAREGPDGAATKRWLAPSVRVIIAQRGLYTHSGSDHSP